MSKLTVIYGQVPSKSNSYKPVVRNGVPMMVSTSAVTKYQKDFYIQVPSHLRGKMIDTFFEFKMNVYYKTLAPDIDGSLKIVLDCLEKAKVIKNDNLCVHLDIRKFKDKNDPRIEFKITEAI